MVPPTFGGTSLPTSMNDQGKCSHMGPQAQSFSDGVSPSAFGLRSSVILYCVKLAVIIYQHEGGVGGALPRGSTAKIEELMSSWVRQEMIRGDRHTLRRQHRR